MLSLHSCRPRLCCFGVLGLICLTVLIAMTLYLQKVETENLLLLGRKQPAMESTQQVTSYLSPLTENKEQASTSWWWPRSNGWRGQSLDINDDDKCTDDCRAPPSRHPSKQLLV
ncbi:hypothetical protein BDF19DRAFT_423202 [Syncephalis fuscata]|nr:hypothetical protein BDF19DRAFT_423202 [Syncephalis fuscata]